MNRLETSAANLICGSCNPQAWSTVCRRMPLASWEAAEPTGSRTCLRMGCGARRGVSNRLGAMACRHGRRGDHGCGHRDCPLERAGSSFVRAATGVDPGLGHPSAMLGREELKLEGEGGRESRHRRSMRSVTPTWIRTLDAPSLTRSAQALVPGTTKPRRRRGVSQRHPLERE